MLDQALLLACTCAPVRKSLEPSNFMRPDMLCTGCPAHADLGCQHWQDNSCKSCLALQHISHNMIILVCMQQLSPVQVNTAIPVTGCMYALASPYYGKPRMW